MIYSPTSYIELIEIERRLANRQKEGGEEGDNVRKVRNSYILLEFDRRVGSPLNKSKISILKA